MRLADETSGTALSADAKIATIQNNEVVHVPKEDFASALNLGVTVAQRVGSTITFDAPAYYNMAAPLTGAVTIDVTGAKAGIPALLACTDTATFPASVDLAGTLQPGTNYVHLLYVSDTLQLAQVHGAPAGAGNPEAVQLAVPTLQTMALSTDEVRLSWDDVANETGTEIQQGTNGTSGTTILTTGADAVVHTVTGLTLSTTYYFRARRKGDGVNFLDSNWSAWVPATTLAVDPFLIESLGATKLIQYNKDSADAANVTVDSGLVSEWKAAIGNSLTQATASLKPTWDANGILTDGVDDRLVGNMAVSESVHVFMVYSNEEAIATADRIFNCTGGTAEWQLQQGAGIYTYSTTSSIGFSPVPVQGSLFLFHGLIDGANSFTRVNDATPNTTVQGTGPYLGAINSTLITLGTRSTGTNATKIRPRELVIAKAGQLTTQDIADIRTELKRRYSL